MSGTEHGHCACLRVILIHAFKKWLAPSWRTFEIHTLEKSKQSLAHVLSNEHTWLIASSGSSWTGCFLFPAVLRLGRALSTDAVGLRLRSLTEGILCFILLRKSCANNVQSQLHEIKVAGCKFINSLA
jgi:hypothetical protein